MFEEEARYFRNNVAEELFLTILLQEKFLYMKFYRQRSHYSKSGLEKENVVN
jgi:hypothetical protein